MEYLNNLPEGTLPFETDQIVTFMENIRYAKDRNEFMYRVTDGGDLVDEMIRTYNLVKETFTSMDKMINSANITIICRNHRDTKLKRQEV